MSHTYTEDQLIEQPFMWLFAEVGWAMGGQHPNAVVRRRPHVAGIVGSETHSKRGWFRDPAGLWTCPTPCLPVEALLIAPSQWTWGLDPYWPHTGLMVDPSANLSA